MHDPKIEVERVKQLLIGYGISEERMRGSIVTGLDVFETRIRKETNSLKQTIIDLNARINEASSWLLEMSERDSVMYHKARKLLGIQE